MLVALLIFFTTFVLLLIWVCTKPKEEMQRNANLPLDESELKEEHRKPGTPS